MCPHEPEGECGHINQIITVHVTCVTGTEIINHVSTIKVVSNHWIGIWTGMELNDRKKQNNEIRSVLSYSSIALQELHTYVQTCYKTTVNLD